MPRWPNSTKPAKKPKLPSTRPVKASLSPAHKKVVDEWFKNGCVSKERALRAAGYADVSAKANQSVIFGRPDVKAEIARRREGMEKRQALTEDMLIAEYRKVAFSSLGDLLEVNEDGSAYLDFNGLTADQKAAMAEFQVEAYDERMPGDGDGEASFVKVKKSRVKFHSKLAALDSLARIMGLFKDKIEVSGSASLVEKVAAARARLAQQKKGAA